MQYLAEVRGRSPEAKDLDDLRTYKTMESLIYRLGGHQKQINRHFEFMRLVTSFLKIEQKVTLYAMNGAQIGQAQSVIDVAPNIAAARYRGRRSAATW
jgi:hypothetical protein